MDGSLARPGRGGSIQRAREWRAFIEAKGRAPGQSPFVPLAVMEDVLLDRWAQAALRRRRAADLACRDSAARLTVR
jgi:hypothetical protein